MGHGKGRAEVLSVLAEEAERAAVLVPKQLPCQD